MTGILVRKYQPLSNLDDWEHSLNLGENDLSPIDLRDKSSERAFAHETTRNPKVSVKISVPWSENEDYDISGYDEADKQLCWGSQCFGLFGSRRKSTRWVEVSFPRETAGNRPYGRRNVEQGYKRPSAWKRMLRKLKARAKEVHVACCEGLCFPRDNSDYNSFNYEKNFDNSSWQQHAADSVSNQRTPLSPHLQKTWKNSSDTGELSLLENPLMQRRNRDAASKLHAKKVTFADV